MNILSQFIGGMLGIMLTLLTSFGAVVTYQTLRTPLPPFTATGGAAIAWSIPDATVVMYTRVPSVNGLIDDDTAVAVHRSVVCDAVGVEVTYDLPTVTVYAAGRGVPRIISYPIQLPLGTRCELNSSIQWRPALSIKLHGRRMPTIYFTVGDRP